VLIEPITDLLTGDKAVTISSRRGHPLVKVGLMPALAAGSAAVLLAPRATAVVAIGAMFRGFSLTIDRVDPAPSTAEAA